VINSILHQLLINGKPVIGAIADEIGPKLLEIAKLHRRFFRPHQDPIA
jgi:hypothetical protein